MSTDQQLDLTTLAHKLANLSGSLGATSLIDLPTLTYHPDREPENRWAAKVAVKRNNQRNRVAWAHAATPGQAMVALLAAVNAMAVGTVPARGGSVTR
jgi:hypothetical protein